MSFDRSHDFASFVGGNSSGSDSMAMPPQTAIEVKAFYDVALDRIVRLSQTERDAVVDERYLRNTIVSCLTAAVGFLFLFETLQRCTWCDPLNLLRGWVRLHRGSVDSDVAIKSLVLVFLYYPAILLAYVPSLVRDGGGLWVLTSLSFLMVGLKSQCLRLSNPK